MPKIKLGHKLEAKLSKKPLKIAIFGAAFLGD
jgi:hypothetical protein